MNNWNLVHRYRALAAWNRVPRIYCPDDEDIELIPVEVDGEDNPGLRCLACNTTFKPGSEVWKTMKENIDEQRS